MSEFGQNLKDFVLKGIETIGSTVGSLASSTRQKVDEFNLENEKTALLSYEIQRETMKTDADVRNENVRRMAEIQMEHTGDMAARMREEAQFAQHMQSEQAAKQAELASQSAYCSL